MGAARDMPWHQRLHCAAERRKAVVRLSAAEERAFRANAPRREDVQLQVYASSDDVEGLRRAGRPLHEQTRSATCSGPGARCHNTLVLGQALTKGVKRLQEGRFNAGQGR